VAGVLIVTTETIPGYQIEAVAGLVDVHVLGSRAHAIDMRSAVRQRLAEEAAELGANAIVGVRIDTGADQTTYAYGTAVWVVPVTVAAAEQYDAMVRDGEVPPQPD
jgi:uncharacterized protein YbjQ (UPF0145 family)